MLLLFLLLWWLWITLSLYLHSFQTQKAGGNVTAPNERFATIFPALHVHCWNLGVVSFTFQPHRIEKLNYVSNDWVEDIDKIHPTKVAGVLPDLNIIYMFNSKTFYLALLQFTQLHKRVAMPLVSKLYWPYLNKNYRSIFHSYHLLCDRYPLNLSIELRRQYNHFEKQCHWSYGLNFHIFMWYKIYGMFSTYVVCKWGRLYVYFR